MSTRRHARTRIDNALLDLVASVKISQTGGSSLSGYDTLSYSNNYALVTLNRIIITYLYSGNGIFQTAVQLPIQDALSKGIEIESGELAAEDIDALLDWFEEKNVWQSLEDFWSWVRCFGGASLIINTSDDPEAPVNMRRLQGKPIEFYDVDRWQLSGTHDFMNNNGYLAYDDMLNSEWLYLNGQKIHSSHCIMGVGKKAPSYIRRQLMGWGMSEAERMLRDLNNYLKTQDVLYEILDESKLDIYKIEGLANKLLTAGGTSSIQARIQSVNELKNYLNALVLDTKDEYEQKTLTFSGLSDVMKENRIGIASAVRMPMTKLFGLSASGFSTGEEDIDNYNTMIESEIRMKLRAPIRRLIEIGCANLFGYVPSFRFSFQSLKVVKESELEVIKKSKTDRILAWYDRGILTSPAATEMAAKEDVLDADIAKMAVENPIPPEKPQDASQPVMDRSPVANAVRKVIKIFRHASS